MKKKILSLIVAVAMLFSVVTFVVQADTDGEGDYLDFMITAENLKLLKVDLRVQQTQ